MTWNHLNMAMLTDIGNVRENNEDAGCFDVARGFCAVADGVGGGAAGEYASATVIDALKTAMTATPDDATPEERIAAMKKAIAKASYAIADYAETHLHNSCGTTVVVLMFSPWHPDEATALHVGDSRVYRLRNRALTPLTQDHTIAAEVGLSENELPRIYRDMLTRAVGIISDCDIERTPISVRADDLFLVCTDGLFKALSPDYLKQLLCANRDLPAPDLAALLMRETLSRRAPDNVTFGIVKVGALPAARQITPDDIARERAAYHRHL
ncbi:MAG TPA: serine/threonine-protein phosphatase [Lentisphaeria bacterium]|nr:serine/threonine-protein phosphatase [Lentisphaeria bacterium]